jgi:extracellular factor (EF) 3-hydroxypalmitic acid methyl ester biosynthesis protein
MNDQNGTALNGRPRKTASVGAGKSGDGADSQVMFEGDNGVKLRGAVLRLCQDHVVFELYQIPPGLQVSHVFKEFTVLLEGRQIYAGKATVCNLINFGSFTACEAKLDPPGLAGTPPGSTVAGPPNAADAYRQFFQRWQAQGKVLPEFKAVVQDIQSYLSTLKLLLEEAEAALGALPAVVRLEREQQAAGELAAPVLASIDTLRERLLEAAARVPAELRPAHERLIRRQLHPLFLCAPFAFRAYQKPLGYAGDYEMMNMIHRNTFEGDSLYAKLVHYWLVNQYPAISVRNRIAHMKSRLVQETIRCSRSQERIRILNVGCGPAREVEQFITECDFADRADFTLVDFDAGTLNYVKRALQNAKARQLRKTTVNLVQMSATRLLKGQTLPSQQAFSKPYDLVYCGGLFDYFTDETCRQLVAAFHQMLAPGGLAVVANMDDRVPYKQMQEYLLDWHLIYRDDRRMAGLVPETVHPDDWKLITEQMGVNLFVEIRKRDSH